MRAWSPRARRALPWVGLLVLVLLLGLLPYVSLLDHIPWGPDAAKWVDRGTVDDRNWTKWVFSTKHFIGYRPLAALSFVINEALTGYEPWGYRATDLLLHLSVGVALFVVHRQLTGDRGAWGLIAVGLVFAHPATEEVLPFVARRSYLMQGLFSLLSIGLALRAVQATSRTTRWALWGTVALATGAALLSNEGGFVVLVWLPFLVLWATQGTMQARLWQILGLLPTLLMAVGVMARRVAVLGSLTGGYGKHFFAFVRDGKVMWRDMHQPDHVAILKACLVYTLAPHGVTGEHVPGLRAASPLAVLSLLVGVVLVARAARATSTPSTNRAEAAPGRPGNPVWLGPLLLVWMAGSIAIVVASGTWFWRQAYFVLPPLGLILSLVARHAVHSARGGRWWSVGASLPALALPAIAVLATGPALKGMNEGAHASRVEYGAHVHAIRRLTAEAQGPGTVYLVIAGKAGSVHNVRIWSNRFGAGRDLVFRVLARLDNSSRASEGRVNLRYPRGRPQLVIDGKHIKWEPKRIGKVKLDGIQRLWLDQLYVEDESRWVYAPSDDVHVLEAVRPPSASDRSKPRDR